MWRITQPMIDFLKEKKLPLQAKYVFYFDTSDLLLHQRGIVLWTEDEFPNYPKHPELIYSDDNDICSWRLKIDGNIISGENNVLSALRAKKLLKEDETIVNQFDRVSFSTSFYRIDVDANTWFEFNGSIEAGDFYIAGNMFGPGLPELHKIPATCHHMTHCFCKRNGLDTNNEDFDANLIDEIDSVIGMKYANNEVNEYSYLFESSDNSDSNESCSDDEYEDIHASKCKVQIVDEDGNVIIDDVEFEK